MNQKNKWIPILVVALALGTGHAIRGQFGHEQGAAWAGAMGAMALILVSGRKDWIKKAFQASLALAVGWGAGGMISYGQIAGRYAQSDNFINVFYGLGMLFIIGGLYGLIGGGLFGLTLDESKNKPVKWGLLLSEMTAGGLITWFFLVAQLGFRMTPPRGDAWAICLGAGLALIWYLARNDHHSVLRVVFYSTLWSGFGFAFGTHFHLVMNWVKIPFNTWNMAEYSIGFFGGAGLAYGVFTSKWNESDSIQEKWTSAAAYALVLLFVPLIIFRESFSYGMFMDKYKDLANTETIAFRNTLTAAILLSAMAISSWWIASKNGFSPSKSGLINLFVIYSLVYSLLSYIASGFYLGHFWSNSNHHLYLVNIVVIAWLARKHLNPFIILADKPQIHTRYWFWLTILIIVSIAVMAVLSIPLHGPTDGSYDRFG